ncbi:glycosyltransferase [Lachnospiraceae bacterium OttesenSCG-928-D06]|nr:glycosyltransferase [Lachnospiraceae bacterium OttesenSCG-928-D06]
MENKIEKDILKGMIFENKKNRKKITVATTITASGVIKAGGTNVINGLYTRLAQYFDIEMVYIAPINEKARRYEIVPGLTEIVIPKTNAHVNAEREITLKLNATTSYDISLLYCLHHTPEYAKVLQESIKTSDIVIVDRPYLYYEVRKYLNGRALLQRSHNIEYFFKKANLPTNNYSSKILADLFELEKECSENCNMNFMCSEEDMCTLNEMYGIENNKINLIPNGVSCTDNPFCSIEERINLKKKYGLANEKIAIFIGGGHRPNIEACEMILNVATYCDDTKFFFAGPLCSTLETKKRSNNVGLLGTISEDSRKYLFSVSDISLNPMFSGSGSNVKMFDYMSMGLPIITSTFGARGISDKSHFHIANSIQELTDAIDNFDLLLEVTNTENARILVETEYDWKVIANKAKDYINEFI